LAEISRPVMVDGQRAAALRWADPVVQALLSTLIDFRLAADGWRQRDLRAPLAALLGQPAETVSAGRMTYQLRRLRLHGLIERVPGRHRYQVTARGLRIALFFTRVHARLFRPGAAALLPAAVRDDSRLRRAFAQLERAMDRYCEEAKLAA
jgi:DNA-binding PadR family transcriptional regulator